MREQIAIRASSSTPTTCLETHPCEAETVAVAARLRLRLRMPLVRRGMAPPSRIAGSINNRGISEDSTVRYKGIIDIRS